MHLEIDARTQDAELFENLPMADAVATFESENSELSVFLLSRELENQTQLSLDLSRFGNIEFIEGFQMGGNSLDLTNNAEYPERVQPQSFAPAAVEKGIIEIVLPQASWSVARFKVT